MYYQSSVFQVETWIFVFEEVVSGFPAIHAGRIKMYTQCLSLGGTARLCYILTLDLRIKFHIAIFLVDVFIQCMFFIIIKRNKNENLLILSIITCSAYYSN